MATPAECPRKSTASVIETIASENGDKKPVEEHFVLPDLSAFKLAKILSNNTRGKSISLLGKFEGHPGDALVILEKSPFAEDKFGPGSDYFNEKSTLDKVFHNHIYLDYQFFTPQLLNPIKTQIIHPATEQHIQKHTPQICHIYDETPEVYNEIVLPHITSKQFNLTWVYNILEHIAESERIVFEDPDPVTGFILVKDLKWNGDIETLYLLAIPHKRDIKSLRDLTGDHLDLLTNIKNKGAEAIKTTYNLQSSRLRVYLHYHPSFYHLHVHFTYLNHEAPGILAERAHLLSNVISNIQLMSNYYQKVTLPFTVRENDALFDSLRLERVPVRNE